MPSSRALPNPLVLVLALIFGVAAPAAAGLPADFDDSLVATIARPTALAFLPDGRLLVAQQTGALRMVKNGALLAPPLEVRLVK